VPSSVTRRVEHFDVHPSVVFKLGEDLISDDVQALAELVKNAYDADAGWAVIRIVTTKSPDEFPEDLGYVEIEDNGVGMTVDNILRGWLTISNSLKREMKSSGKTTKKGRTPLGDKGLGRLGAQRLGNRLTIETTPVGGKVTNKLSFDWRDFHRVQAMSEFDLEISSTRSTRKPGTRILISDLNEPQELEDIERLQIALAKVVSPYGGVAAFNLGVTLNGESVDLTEIEIKLREAAVVRYRIGFDDKGVLKMTGKMRLAHLRPNAKKDRPEFQRTCEKDRGRALFAFLSQRPSAKDFRLKLSRSPSWWVEFESRIDLDAIAPKMADGKPANPGPFSGEIDVFNLSPGAMEDMSVFDNLADLRKHINELHGIRIYRDGFNVRVDDDWLGLGKRWSSASSWYGLRPATTLGYVALSAAGNGQLIETTDREGFKRTPHYENFEDLLKEFVIRTGDIHEFIGRGAVDFRRSLNQPGDNQDAGSTIDRISESLNKAQGFTQSLGAMRTRLETDSGEADQVLKGIAQSDHQPTEDELELMASLNSLSRHAAGAAELVVELETFVGELAIQRSAGVQLQGELDMLREQLGLAYETVAVGLTAEALSHEIANIADRLARRTAEVSRYVNRAIPDDRKVIVFVEHVRGSIAGLRRQLSHLAPSLRYVRERREELVLSDILQEVRAYFDARWKGEGITLNIDIKRDGVVLMNRGKFMQICDNLFLNSEYWLKEEIRLERIDRGRVDVRVDEYWVEVKDNGRGIDKQVENSLFEPFVTRKPKGIGRGLGLFITRQLLAAEGCDIDLSPERNRSGRKYIFEVDLSGAAFKQG
jgi:signal transduction histidine kinase